MLDQTELWEHLHDQYGLFLLQDEMDSIIHIVIQQLRKDPEYFPVTTSLLTARATAQKIKVMKKIIVTDRTAVALQPGNRFRFPDDETEYEFWYIMYKTDVPWITYYDSDKKRKRQGFHLLDLIRV